MTHYPSTGSSYFAALATALTATIEETGNPSASQGIRFTTGRRFPFQIYYPRSERYCESEQLFLIDAELFLIAIVVLRRSVKNAYSNPNSFLLRSITSGFPAAEHQDDVPRADRLTSIPRAS